ncbi:MAG: hypothetical protein ACP5NF_01535 [Thermoanaerobaculum sp.]
MRNALLFIVTVAVLAGGLAAQQGVNLQAIHDPQSQSYNPRCLSCHQGVLRDGSQDPRVASFHQAMLPFTPGYSARKGAQDNNCVFCHRNAVDFDQGSAASLRRNVAVEACVYCHGRSGPGPVYYR